MAQRVFTAVIHTVRFLRYAGYQVPFLNDVFFATATAHWQGALRPMTMGQMLFRILPRIVWLIYRTKCVGCAQSTARFVALGTLVDLAEQKFFVHGGAH